MNKKALVLTALIGKIFASDSQTALDRSAFDRLCSTVTAQANAASDEACESEENKKLRQFPSIETFLSDVAKFKHEILMQEDEQRKSLLRSFEYRFNEIRKDEIRCLLPFVGYGGSYPANRLSLFADPSTRRNFNLSWGHPYGFDPDIKLSNLYNRGIPFYLEARDSHVAIAFGLELTTSGVYNLKIAPFSSKNGEKLLVEGGVFQLCTAVDKLNMTPVSKAKLFSSLLDDYSKLNDKKLSYESINPVGNPDYNGIGNLYFNLRLGGLSLFDFERYVFQVLEKTSAEFVAAYKSYVKDASTEDLNPTVSDNPQIIQLIKELKILCTPNA